MNTAALLQLPLWSDASDEAGWRVRRSARARRLAVRVFRDGVVEIIVPPRVAPPQVAAFVARHRDWIIRQQRRLPRVDLDFPPAMLSLPALGEQWRCVAIPGSEARPRALAGGEPRPGAARRRAPLLRAHRQSPAGGVLELQLSEGAPAGAAAVLDWLVQRAAEAFEPQLVALAGSMGGGFRRMQIRRQRTRWGSCSTRGTISLNCCLLFQDPAVVRYLLVHELAHVAHMNHSARFWAHVADHEPQWRELDAELARGWSRVPGWVLAALRA